MMRRLAPLLVLAAAGCAYYNGIYNAKSAAKAGDEQLHRGETHTGMQEFLKSATKAETVLARHPKSHWRSDALYYSARGYALAGDCTRGMRRLDEYLALENQSTARRERALIARASCIMSSSLLSADTVLRPLLESADAEVRGDAALWAGRVALAMGDAERAEQLLARVPGSAAAWEFMAAAFQRNNVARAESLLVLRATAGEWRSEVRAHVRTLWGLDRREGAVRIVDLYGRSRAPTTERVALRFLIGDLAAVAGDTALARRQATEAQRLALSATVDAEAGARLLALRIREFDALADVDAALARDSARARGTPLLARIRDHLTLVRLYLASPNREGAGVFLAAEVARDSLSALRLAHALFRSIERDMPESRLNGRALLAASRIFPESAASYEARILERFSRSSAVIKLLHLNADSTTVRNEETFLLQSATVVARQWGDTLKARKTADSLAALGVRRQ